MDRKDFMKELEYLLQDIPEEEKGDAIAYYRDYLEDAGDEHESDVIREFGSPERVAAIIRADLGGNLEEGGEFTESGYQDERFRDPRYQVAERQKMQNDDKGWQEGAAGGSKEKQRGGFRMERGFLAKGSPASRVLKVLLILALFCMVSPVLLGIGGGIAGVAAAAFVFMMALILLAGVLTATAWIGAVALLALGGGMLFAYPWSGVLLIGCGVFVMGLAFLGVAVSILIYGKLIPFVICSVVNSLNQLLYRRRRDRT